MAEDNVDLFRRAVELVARGDEAVLGFVDEDVEVITRRSGTEGAFRGHEGVRAFLADNRESFDLYEADYADVRDLGDGRVLAFGTVRIRGRGSGAEAEVPSAVVAEFRDGRMTHFRDYGDQRVALEAAGLA